MGWAGEEGRGGRSLRWPTAPRWPLPAGAGPGCGASAEAAFWGGGCRWRLRWSLAAEMSPEAWGPVSSDDREPGRLSGPVSVSHMAGSLLARAPLGAGQRLTRGGFSARPISDAESSRRSPGVA